MKEAPESSLPTALCPGRTSSPRHRACKAAACGQAHLVEPAHGHQDGLVRPGQPEPLAALLQAGPVGNRGAGLRAPCSPWGRGNALSSQSSPFVGGQMRVAGLGGPGALRSCVCTCTCTWGCHWLTHCMVGRWAGEWGAWLRTDRLGQAPVVDVRMLVAYMALAACTGLCSNWKHSSLELRWQGCCTYCSCVTPEPATHKPSH